MPGMICSIIGCNSNSMKARASGEKITFFTFPKNEEIRNEWIKRCKRKENTNFNTEYKRVCSKHFTMEDYEDRIRASIMNVRPKRLKETAVPTLCLDETTRQEDSDSNSNQDFEIIYITGSPEDHESEYEILLKKYNDLLEENQHLKKLLNKYLTEETNRINTRTKKRKIITPFVAKHFSELYACDED